MRVGFFLSIIFIVFVSAILFFYFFLPSKPVDIGSVYGTTNFSVGEVSLETMQFYENMRFPTNQITYSIDENCPLNKKNDMEEAFSILESETSLNFVSVNSGEQISVSCDSDAKTEGGLFIAGEGGPVNITQVEKFYVILNGEILLIRDSDCPTPNVAIHELLHVLGFDHSENPQNIMYSISRASCDQLIGEDTIELINTLYSYTSYPDLAFEEVLAIKRGIYLDVNMTIKNHGLQKSEEATINIYVDGESIKKIDLESLDIGYGRFISLGNLWVKTRTFDEVEIIIDYDFEELDKENNKVLLKVKK